MKAQLQYVPDVNAFTFQFRPSSALNQTTTDRTYRLLVEETTPQSNAPVEVKFMSNRDTRTLRDNKSWLQSIKAPEDASTIAQNRKSNPSLLNVQVPRPKPKIPQPPVKPSIFDDSIVSSSPRSADVEPSQKHSRSSTRSSPRSPLAPSGLGSPKPLIPFQDFYIAFESPEVEAQRQAKAKGLAATDLRFPGSPKPRDHRTHNHGMKARQDLEDKRRELRKKLNKSPEQNRVKRRAGQN